MKCIHAALAIVTCLAIATGAQAEEPVGDWGGVLLGRIHVVFHIRRDAQGRYDATTESPDQSDTIIAVDTIEAGPDHLELTISKLHAKFAGAWDAQKKAWVGRLTQGQELPLVLHRLSAEELAAMKPHRPQDEAAAAAMAAFRQEAVRISNTNAPGVTLAGAFSKPLGPGPFPAVLLIAGSGPQTRDEEVARHKVFLVLAAELNRRGLAVLRYDKRGVGESTGESRKATTLDYASDAAAAFRYMASRPDVDVRRAGLIGHSEGGAIAPMVANEEPNVAFVVLMAGPGQRGADMLLLQQQLIAEAEGTPKPVVTAMLSRNRAIYDAVLGASDQPEAARRLEVLDAAATGAAGSALVYADPWKFFFLRYDPRPALERLRIPVLAITGARDLQVPAAANLPLIRQALERNRDATVREIPGLNHLFQNAETGAPAEYTRIQETISPAALGAVGDWIESHVHGPAGDR